MPSRRCQRRITLTSATFITPVTPAHGLCREGLDVGQNSMQIWGVSGSILDAIQQVEDIDTAERLIADEDELLIRVSKGMKRTHIDKTLNRLFKKHIEFEKGRQTRNPNRSNARYSLSKPIAIDSLQTAFALYDLIEQAEANGEKVNNYALAKQVGIEVEQRNTDEEWNVAYKRRVVSVAVSRKKKVAVDAISNVAKGVFP